MSFVDSFKGHFFSLEVALWIGQLMTQWKHLFPPVTSFEKE